MNFSVILFEAGRFEMNQVQKALSQNPYDCDFSLGLWGFWAKTNECQNLFSYIQATQTTNNPLKIGGFDIQPSGDFTDSARIVQIDQYLQNKNISLALFPTLKKGLLDYNAVNYWEYRKSKEEVKEIAEDLEKMILHCSLYPLPEDSLFIPYLRNMAASISIFNTEERASALRLQKRDSLLAQNVFELKEHYKAQKIIIWIANLHALYDNRKYASKNERYTFISFGEQLKTHYPNQTYTLCFTSYLNIDKGRITKKASQKTWEAAIHAKGYPYIFLNFRELPNEKIFNKNMKMRCNQLDNLSANWSQMTDGIFYTDTSYQITQYEMNKN